MTGPGGYDWYLQALLQQQEALAGLVTLLDDNPTSDVALREVERRERVFREQQPHAKTVQSRLPLAMALESVTEDLIAGRFG